MNKFTPPELQEAFDTFWDAYPRKTAKKTARKAWAKLNPSTELILTILNDIDIRVEIQWQDKQFIPHPATYLNGERWEDEIISAAPKIAPALGPSTKSRDRTIQDQLNDKSWAK